MFISESEMMKIEFDFLTNEFQNDNIIMEQVIELAQKGSGFVNPQPLEGGMLYRDNTCIATDYRKSPTTEFSVFDRLFEKVPGHTEATSGLTMYVNIEPLLTEQEQACKLMLRSYKQRGLERIVVGLLRPNQVFKQASRILDLAKEEGIEVISGICSEKCREQNEIYLHYAVTKTPFVFVKWAMTLDGKLASRTGDSKWISSEESLKFVHILRQRVAAIMVGEGTVIADNPLLTTRLDVETVSHPLRIILSRLGNIPDNSNVLQVTESVRTLLITSEKLSVERERFFVSRGVLVLKIREVKGRIPLREMLSKLGEMGIDSLYIEGGSSLLGDAFDSGIVRKVYTAVAPKIIGGKNAYTPVGGQGIEKMSDAIELQQVSYEIIGSDVIIKGYINLK